MVKLLEILLILSSDIPPARKKGLEIERLLIKFQLKDEPDPPNRVLFAV